jgi:L-rhamnose-H+ transport protein
MNVTAGILIAILAGAMNGLFMLPMRANKQWAWENNWLPFSILSFAIFPCLIAWITIPDVLAVYLHSDGMDIFAALLCGTLAYTGSLLFGISAVQIGVALSFSLLVGTMSAVGVMAPRLLLHHSLFGSASDDFVFAGVCLSLVSVVFGFVANRGKCARGERAAGSAASSATGCALAIAGGALSGLLPSGMAMPWAHRLIDCAIANGGAQPAQASNAVLALVLLGGALPNCGYCAYLLRVNATYRNYIRKSRTLYWLIILCMGFLYSASIALWGIAISPRLLGAFGPSVGWALFVGMIVIASTTAGLLSSEWRAARLSSIAFLVSSLVALISATILICYGTYLS